MPIGGGPAGKRLGAPLRPPPAPAQPASPANPGLLLALGRLPLSRQPPPKRVQLLNQPPPAAGRGRQRDSRRLFRSSCHKSVSSLDGLLLRDTLVPRACGATVFSEPKRTILITALESVGTRDAVSPSPTPVGYSSGHVSLFPLRRSCLRGGLSGAGAPRFLPGGHAQSQHEPMTTC